MMADRCRCSRRDDRSRTFGATTIPCLIDGWEAGSRLHFRAEYEKIAIRTGTFPSAAKFDKNRVGDVDT
jgi:hypothetical protein